MKWTRHALRTNVRKSCQPMRISNALHAFRVVHPDPMSAKRRSQRRVSSTVCTYACTVLPRSLARLQYLRGNAWTLLNGLYYAPNVTSSVECPTLQGIKVKRYGRKRDVPGCSMCQRLRLELLGADLTLKLNDTHTYVQYRDSLNADTKTPTNTATQRSASRSSRLSLLPASITTVQVLSETRRLARRRVPRLACHL
jgi:hypothetical protein